jgi:hypothetical protein
MNARELKLERCVDAFQGFGQLPILQNHALLPTSEAYELGGTRSSGAAVVEALMRSLHVAGSACGDP